MEKKTVRKKISRKGARRPWQDPSKKEPASRNDEKSSVRLGQNKAYYPQMVKMLNGFGKAYNSYEVCGEENIPLSGPALIVFYHGLVPIDAWYFAAHYYQKTGRKIRGLGDKFLFRTPGLKWVVDQFGVVEANKTNALKLLNEGEIIGVSPGGVREAISGSHNNYKLNWNGRSGFAQIAKEAGCPIIPAFTENIEQTYVAPLADSKFSKFLYNKTKLPLTPIFGLGPLPFPAKLKSWVGPCIYPKAKETEKDLTKRVQSALQELIEEHQNPYESLGSAIQSRFVD